MQDLSAVAAGSGTVAEALLQRVDPAAQLEGSAGLPVHRREHRGTPHEIIQCCVDICLVSVLIQQQSLSRE
jgi:hypothetical protein